jgi:DNA polymerase V
MSCTCNGAAAAPLAEDTGCSGGESFALRVLGDEMTPEFNHGDIIVIEPDGALHDGCFVLALVDGQYHFRQLLAQGDGWLLHALNPAAEGRADLPLADLEAVRGLVIQKAVPGRRRLSKSYLPAHR